MRAYRRIELVPVVERICDPSRVRVLPSKPVLIDYIFECDLLPHNLA